MFSATLHPASAGTAKISKARESGRAILRVEVVMGTA
jgi:hypothetical protein